MKRNWTIHTKEDFLKAMIELGELVDGKPFILSHRPHDPESSEEMRRLYRIWNRQVADHYGNDEDWQHQWFKGKFLVPILMETDDSFRETAAHVNTIWKAGMKEQAHAVRKRMVEESSTVGLPKDDMKRFMESVEKWAMNQGIALARPEEEGR